MPSDSPSLRDLVTAAVDSALTMSSLELSPGERLAVETSESDTYLFAIGGSAHITLRSGPSTELRVGHAAFIPSGDGAEAHAGRAGLAVLRSEVTSHCDVHAPLGATEHFASVESATTAEATSKRTFQVLFGPHNGSCRATLFVGYVPPGKAPWHFHQYDEIVWIWKGAARFHTVDDLHELREASAVRMRPRQVHTLENLSTEDELILLGLFTPAGSPAAAFLARD
jgi:quercetin dioxygenase-like cupin family protein